MKIYKLSEFTRGWVVGDFEPSIFKTKDFEVAVMNINKGEKDEKHIHKLSDEITIIASGKFKINGEIFGTGDIIYMPKGEPLSDECLESGIQTVIKIPSTKGDKFLVN